MLGDDELQVKLVIVHIALAMLIAAMMPIMMPGESTTGYSLDDVYAQRANLESYTGENMINQAPFMLTHVYTPYVAGDEYKTTEDGWLYGSELVDGNGDPYYAPSTGGGNQIGKAGGVVKLDPAAKSDVPLFQSTYYSSVQTDTLKWVYTASDGGLNTLGGIVQWLGGDVYEHRYESFPTWNYSGYRYEFDPMLRINTSNGADQRTVDDATLSIVWYDLSGQEGISGGLVLYDDKTNGIVANYSATEIVAGYNVSSALPSKYDLNFNGTKVSMYIQFDPEVTTGTMTLADAWTAGKWTVAFTAVSADAYLDITNSNSFSSSLGNILSTYLGMMTMNLPAMPAEWELVIWIICTLPLAMAVLLFLSRFGAKGVGAGILGMVLTGGVII